MRQRLSIMPTDFLAMPVSDGAKVVLAAICSFANQSNESACFKSYADLAAMTHRKERACMDAVKELVDAGLIRKEPRFVDGRQSTNALTPCWSVTVGVHETAPRPARDRRGEGAESCTPEGAPNRTQNNPVGMSPEKNSSAKRSKAKPEQSESERETWLTPYAEIYARHVGTPPFGQMAKYLRPAHDADPDALLRNWKLWCGDPAARDYGRGSIRWFSENWRGVEDEWRRRDPVAWGCWANAQAVPDERGLFQVPC